MGAATFNPLYQLTRGEIIESVHFGAVAVVEETGKLMAGSGDPRAVTYLRSTAKPFQALPLMEAGGPGALGLSLAEIALICASHSGSDAHLAAVQSIQAKAGLTVDDLLCGVHPPFDEDAARALQVRGESPTPNHHNCSGKHSGMLALAQLRGWSTHDYLDPNHPVQLEILQTFAEMCDLTPDEVVVGIDGCSAPNFAVPLSHAALAYARLSAAKRPDGNGLAPNRAAACRTILSAMTAHPEMVAGAGLFDTRLMQVGEGRLVVKGGAEGYLGVGVLPGARGPGSLALGIAIKISDGDPAGRARQGVALEVLRQLGILGADELEQLAEFGPRRPIRNWREIPVGTAEPCLSLHNQSR